MFSREDILFKEEEHIIYGAQNARGCSSEQWAAGRKDPPGAGGRRGWHRAPFTPGLPAHSGQRWRRELSFYTCTRVKPGSEDHACSAALRPSPLPTTGLVRMYSSPDPTSQPLRPHCPPPSVGQGRGGCDSPGDPAMLCSLQSPQEVKPLCDRLTPDPH